MRVKYEDGREKCNKGCAAPYPIPCYELVGSRAQGYAAPPSNINQEPAGSSAKGDAPTGVTREKLYSAAIGNKTQQQHFKITVKSKDKLSAEAVKGILKSKINPTDN